MSARERLRGWFLNEWTETDDLGAQRLRQELLEEQTGRRFTRTSRPGDGVAPDKWVRLIEIGGAALVDQEEATVRQAARLLRMVHELHKLGFQRLRIMPGMAPSGLAWRCSILPRSQVLKNHGAWGVAWNQFGPNYTSAAGNHYFDWDNATRDNARQLAAKFLARFPDVAALGEGRDWEYAGWFVEMLGHAERGAFPVAYQEYATPDPEWLATTTGGRIPMPPGGDADTGDYDPFRCRMRAHLSHRRREVLP